MGKRNKTHFVWASIIALFIIIGIIKVIDINEEKMKANEFEELKTYLKENFDQFVIDGSTSTIPLHTAIRNTFSSKRSEIQHSKTVDAFNKLIMGEVDILLGVDYSDELFKVAKDNGIDLGKAEITKEAFVFLINRNNPVKSLTIEQIKDIYSGKITNWNQVGGDDAPIKAFQRNSDSGSQMRMVKFMGDTQLIDKEVTYFAGMGDIIESIANYDMGKYSIGYSMYTFTEKQYLNKDVVMLEVNGIQPNDKTILDDSYPIVIYNYMFYDKNNSLVTEYVEHLYQFLMHDEGQKLISDAGYVNLKTVLDRNKEILLPYDPDSEGDMNFFDFYNESKGEFYKVDSNGKLLVYTSFSDYVLNESEFKENENARRYLTRIFESDIPLNPETVQLNKETASIEIGFWFDGSMDEEDFFNVRYRDMYYKNLEYFFIDNRYVLNSIDKEQLDSHLKSGFLDKYSEYTSNIMYDTTLDISEEELKEVYFRLNNYSSTQSLNYIQPFN